MVTYAAAVRKSKSPSIVSQTRAGSGLQAESQPENETWMGADAPRAQQDLSDAFCHKRDGTPESTPSASAPGALPPSPAAAASRAPAASRASLWRPSATRSSAATATGRTLHAARKFHFVARHRAGVHHADLEVSTRLLLNKRDIIPRDLALVYLDVAHQIVADGAGQGLAV